MLNTIIVGVDGRDASDDAVALARALSRLDDAEIAVISVYAATPSVDPKIRWEHVKYASDADAALDRVRGYFRDAANVTYDAVPGTSPAGGLQLAAADRAADLIVIGATHASRLGHAVGSDLLTKLMWEPRQPVAVAPRGYAADAPERVARIGVAYDGGQETEAALRFAAQMAGATEEHPGQVDAIYVDAHAPGLERRPSGEPVAATAARHRVIDGILSQVEREMPATVTVNRVELHGRPARELIEMTHDLDLLVTGTHGRGPIGQLLHGSVVRDVAQQAACPIVAVPLVAATAERG